MLSKFDLDEIRAALEASKGMTLITPGAVERVALVTRGLASLDRLIEAERCNGWSNWETWNVALWLSNDAGTYHASRALVSAGSLEGGTAAESLKEYCDELTQSDDAPASMATDLLRGALAAVNWQEIARNIHSEL